MEKNRCKHCNCNCNCEKDCSNCDCKNCKCKQPEPEGVVIDDTGECESCQWISFI